MQRSFYRIPVGKRLRCDALLEALKENENALFEILVGDLSRYDLRATYSTDSLILDSIRKDTRRSHYWLLYSFEWEAYHGCPEMDNSDTVEDEIAFTYLGGEAIFEKRAVADRTTYEEF